MLDIGRMFLICIVAFGVGAVFAFSCKRLYQEWIGPWLKERAEARALLPGSRKALLSKAWRVARSLEALGKHNDDVQTHLLGFVLVQALCRVDQPPVRQYDSLTRRMGALREAADALGYKWEDKWWRAREHWSTVRVNEIVEAAGKERVRR